MSSKCARSGTRWRHCAKSVSHPITQSVRVFSICCCWYLYATSARSRRMSTTTYVQGCGDCPESFTSCLYIHDNGDVIRVLYAQETGFLTIQSKPQLFQELSDVTRLKSLCFTIILFLKNTTVNKKTEMWWLEHVTSSVYRWSSESTVFKQRGDFPFLLKKVLSFPTSMIKFFVWSLYFKIRFDQNCKRRSHEAGLTCRSRKFMKSTFISSSSCHSTGNSILSYKNNNN